MNQGERLRITRAGVGNTHFDIGFWTETPNGPVQTKRKVTINHRLLTRLIVGLQKFHQLQSSEDSRQVVLK